MDVEKLKQWLDVAKSMQGGDFWGNIFDQEFAKQFINEQQMKGPFSNTNQQASRDAGSARTFPIIDVLEGEEEVIIIIELPGILKENVELGLNNNILTVKGKALPLHPQLKLSYSERFYGDFQRQITLPDSITPNEISAKFWNGVLLVRYPRMVDKGEMIPID
ncbi:Hsp20/alpha crystallin family protein [Neobacillus sp. OS1-32]|jgi:HSP20 family protein|uniref:Hsp20/alpha crystallin family protein n=1 Tax=Neobacillus paridis TaxID=2803862 RepID=A0ABS1TRL8_9BACI|nr:MULTISPECIES: Hsp20/alpha crystallin family protein [Neobacillus]MBL4953912.1 Hsp20/alpha crystallin family protein [Neobacillus paridis]WML31026.1 Hsp20/alpha crystallin family protein [Neobacillus sp. OS1-32]